MSGTLTNFADDLITARAMQRRDARRRRRGSLSEADVRLIRASRQSGLALARQFGVAPASISRARNGQTWRKIGEITS